MNFGDPGGAAPNFKATLPHHGLFALHRDAVRVLQVNVGKLCNQACHHCHVDAGPKRAEIMTRPTAERIATLLAQSSGVDTTDLTGGAPELNPNFAFLVEHAKALGRHVIVRCNLTPETRTQQYARAAIIRGHVS